MDAIAAGQIEATAVPLREDDNDDETVHGIPTTASVSAAPPVPPTPPALLIPTNPPPIPFDGFAEFDIDLSFSPNLPPPTPSPPPSPLLSRSISFARHIQPNIRKKSMKRQSSPLLPAPNPTSFAHGTWPSTEYTGRGTPIDRGKRVEWGGVIGQDVDEDGVLFSTVRSTSLDSTVRHPSGRSISPEWNYLAPATLSAPSSPSAKMRSLRRRSTGEKAPELSPLTLSSLGADRSDDWASIMQTVLSTTGEDSASRAAASTEPEKFASVSASAAPARAPDAQPEQPTQTDAEMEADLGLDAALDVGLGLRGPGMNWFDLGLLPTTGHDSPSVYSTHSLPVSQPPSVHASEDRSAASTRTETNGRAEKKPGRSCWWRKAFGRMCRIPEIIHTHKNR